MVVATAPAGAVRSRNSGVSFIFSLVQRASRASRRFLRSSAIASSQASVMSKSMGMPFSEDSGESESPTSPTSATHLPLLRKELRLPLGRLMSCASSIHGRAREERRAAADEDDAAPTLLVRETRSGLTAGVSTDMCAVFSLMSTTVGSLVVDVDGIVQPDSKTIPLPPTLVTE